MKRCVFFGHRNCPITIKPMLQGAIMELIENGYDDLMVGNNGGFDQMVQHCLEELSHTFGGFRYSIVLERLPKAGEEKIENSILADGIEECPARFSIDRRNEYMLRAADVVVCYITKGYGGAYKFVDKARRRKKRIINIADKKDRQ